ncbi:MAG TPA: radical SAM family heme chaperone HemW, partial [Caulobacteraceae bacterium]
FNVVRARGREAEQARLAEAIVADIGRHGVRLGRRRLTSIFLGGGTPSLMEPAAVAAVIAAAGAAFAPAGDLEVTLEANPTDAEAERFADLARAGVTRLSLGVQSFDDAALRFLGRNHGSAEARRAAGVAAAAFGRVSLDLIYARPGQTTDDWRRDLDEALAFAPEHLSPYQLTVEAGTAFGRAVARGAWAPADDGAGADLYDQTQVVLGAAGLEAYEVSNHARSPAARSRHNLSIWRGGDYAGVGPGAHGRLTLDGARHATIAAGGVADYLGRIESGRSPWVDDQRLTPQESAEERVMLGLRIREGVEIAALEALGLSTTDDRVAPLLHDGLMVVNDGRLAATETGRPLLDSLVRALLA